ncbi:MAG: hypothetical protein APR63_03115 [Desulfuromonas sp. SDB]|nr:MAG: hypothetical protein APR63_03115 [Desulfuromonas sp. SDB]
MKKIFMVAVLTAFFTFPVNADFFAVNSLTGLQSSLNTASANGANDTILIMNGNYNVTATVNFISSENFSLTLTGQDSGSVIFNASNLCQIFNFTSSGNQADLIIHNLVFTSGNSNDYGGGLYAETSSSDILVNRCVFSYCYASNFGGGAGLVSNSGDITVSNSNFYADSSNNDAGGLFAGTTSGNIYLTSSVFTDNSANGDDAGGVMLYTEQTCTISAQNNYFQNNYAEDDGGGLFLYFLGSGILADVHDNNFYSNLADLGGGGCFIRVNDSGTVNYTGNTATLNSTNTGCGGGTFIYLNSGYLYFSENHLQDNSCGEHGAGSWIWNGQGYLIVYENEFQGNQSSQNGGGVDISTDHGIMNFSRNIIYGNSAVNVGGGVSTATTDGQLIIFQNTFYDNNAADGGGLCSYIDQPSGQANISNNILWNDNPNEISYSGAVSLNCRYSDIENGTGNTWFGTGCIDVDPKFVDPVNGDFNLSWNNFPVNDTSKSPCIDTGDPSSPPDPDSTRADMGALYFNQSTGVDETPVISSRIIEPIININSEQNCLELYLPTFIQYPLNLSIFNITGQLIDSAYYDQIQQEPVRINLNNYVSGIYICRIEGIRYNYSEKFILIY